MRTNNILATLLAAIIVGVMLLVAGGLVVSSSSQQSRALDAQTAALETQNVSHGVALALLQVEEARITDLHDELEALRLSLPESTDLSPFILQLDALAAEHQVVVEAVTVSAAQVQPSRQATAAGSPAPTTAAPLRPGTLLGVPISLNVSGSYDGVLAFLNSLQRGERMLSVTSFNTSLTGVDANAVTGSISAIVYVLTGAPDD